jgi:hypothetical protein
VEIALDGALGEELDHFNVLRQDLLLLSELVLSKSVEEKNQVAVVELFVDVRL